MRVLSVDGIAVEVMEKKGKRNMTMRVLPPDGRLQVTVGPRCPIAVIEGFVRSKMAWVLTQQRKYRMLCAFYNLRTGERLFESGEKVKIWGNMYLLFVTSSLHVEGKKPITKSGIYFSGDRAYMVVPSDPQMTADEAFKKRKKVFDTFLKKELEKEIKNRLPYYENLLGLDCAEHNIRSMKSRWGTCHISKRKITFSSELAKKPPECLDYIIVHELAHILYSDHGASFKTYLDKWYPQWRKVRSRLNDTVLDFYY